MGIWIYIYIYYIINKIPPAPYEMNIYFYQTLHENKLPNYLPAMAKMGLVLLT